MSNCEVPKCEADRLTKFPLCALHRYAAVWGEAKFPKGYKPSDECYESLGL